MSDTRPPATADHRSRWMFGACALCLGAGVFLGNLGGSTEVAAAPPPEVPKVLPAPMPQAPVTGPRSAVERLDRLPGVSVPPRTSQEFPQTSPGRSDRVLPTVTPTATEPLTQPASSTLAPAGTSGLGTPEVIKSSPPPTYSPPQWTTVTAPDEPPTEEPPCPAITTTETTPPAETPPPVTTEPPDSTTTPPCQG